MSMKDQALQDATARRLVEALPLLEQTLEMRKVTLGPEHRSTLKLMHNLARAYKCAGRLGEALQLFERTLELRKATLGPEDWDTVSSMSILANEYESAGRQADAVALYEQTLLLYQSTLLRYQTTLGPEHEYSLISMNNLARAFAKAGRLAEAVPLFEQTLEFMNEKFGPDYMLGSMAYLAKAYLAGEQPEKALPMFDRFIAGHRGRATPDDLRFAGLLISVSADLLQHRQYEAAETCLRECVTIREKQLPDDFRLFNAKSTLGGALAGQKKFQEAEPLLVEGYSGMKAREAKIPPAVQTRLPEAIQRLVDLYVAWEKPEQAAEWQKQLDQAQATLKDTEPKPSKEPSKK